MRRRHVQLFLVDLLCSVTISLLVKQGTSSRISTIATTTSAHDSTMHSGMAKIHEGFSSMVSSFFQENTNHVSVRRSRASRALEQKGKSSRRQFPECIEQNLSPKECQTFIEQLIESEGGHEVGDINVKIRNPRTPDVMNDTYWMVEVPVNINGKVACQINDGKTFYPFKWHAMELPTYYILDFDVEDVDCLGLSAGECCLKVLNYGQDLTGWGYDTNGKCLACFAHQVPLSPIVVNNGEGSSSNISGDKKSKAAETSYLSHELFPKSQVNDSFFHPSADGCSIVTYTSDQVDAYDATLSTIYQTAYTLLENTLEKDEPEICINDFGGVLIALWNAAVTIPPLNELTGQLACTLCYERVYDVVIGKKSTKDPKIKKLINDMLTLLKTYEHSSREHCIIIHTNSDDEIVKTPELPTISQDDAKEIDPNTPCNVDIRVCAEGEYCTSVDYYGPDESPKSYECRPYLQTGEECILWQEPNDPFVRVPDKCDPLVGYCKPDPRDCGLNDGHFPANTFPSYGTCTPYGKPCTKDNGACDSIAEYCHIDGEITLNNLVGHCLPKLQKGTCCNPNAEENVYFEAYIIGHTCQLGCTTDEECKEIDDRYTKCDMKGIAAYYGFENIANDEYGTCT